MKTKRRSWVIDQQTGDGSQPQTHPATADKDVARRPQVKGKFFYVGDEKLYLRGVTYGTFRPDDSGNEFPNSDVVEKDFAQMATIGINVVRIYTPPPIWLLDAALKKKLYVMVGLPWEQHVTFLESKKTARSIEDRIRTMIRGISFHPALFCYVIGNEIPSSIVRWHGRKKIERYLKRLYFIAKKEDPEGLVTYVNFPTTEYLQLPFLDFHCFNVYLEKQERLESYLNRLQNIAGDLPLVMGEIGMDSRRNGKEKQAEVLDWQIRTAFRLGCAGAFVFGWTDEWHRGGFDIEDWDFGLTDRKRRPKKALQSVQKAFSEVPFPPDVPWPRISVVVCSYNGSYTIRNCFEGLLKLDYPNFEVIVVNDGSTDETATIAREYDGFRLINTENRGLSNARNIGLEAATGEIVAYIDDDAFPDQDWLKYLAATFLTTDHAGIGGPNIAPPGDGPIADCVANAPGGPVHVLLSDQEAEHIPGCNMAFRETALQAIGGFDVQFRTAGDDVDICWRLRQRGWTLGFSPAAMVFHHCRNSLRTYLKQQLGYGKAEALLERKWPQKYNTIGHINWDGRIYGNAATKSVGWRKWRVYYGTWGSAPFQLLYGHRSTFLQSLPLTPEWYMVNIALLLLSALGLAWKPLFIAIPLFVVSTSLPLINVAKSVPEATSKTVSLSSFNRRKLRLLTGYLHIVQPLARLYGRFCCGLTPWRQRVSSCYIFPRSRKYKIWSESWRSPKNWIQSIETAILKQGAVVKQGSDFDPWDLEIRGGLCGAVRTQMAIEEHGGDKQFVRFRTWPIIYPMGLALILLFVFLSLLAVVDQVWLVAVLLIIASVVLMIDFFRHCGVATNVCKKVFQDEESLLKDDVEIEKDFVLREKLRKGIMLEDFDRRQNRDPYYSGPERRGGIERRNGIIFVDFDRRQNNNHRYSDPERRNGIERIKSFTAASSHNRGDEFDF
jgi:GT2 family glycosyltransferase